MKKWNERFSASEDSVQWPDCPDCIHFHRASSTCPAYPGGIPIPVRHGQELHRTVRPDQMGTIVFTPNPGKE